MPRPGSTAEPLEHVHRLPDEDAVAAAVADRVLELLADAQAATGHASLVLTGGTISRKVHRRLATHVHRDAVNWSRVEVWWGDERYVPSDDAERNAGQAWEDLLQHLPVDPVRVHAMPASDDDHLDADAAAWAFSQELHSVVTSGGPWFDVLMLGVGPDGHCASLFPDHPEVASDADVLAVHDSPKPPPTRITMGMTTLQRASRMLFVAAGEGKAGAVARSVSGDDVSRTPAAGPRGLESTEWYVDEAAASALP